MAAIKLKTLQVQEIGFEFFVHAGDGFKDAVGKISADYRCDLHGALDIVLQPINSGREGGAVTAARIAFKYLAAPARTSRTRPSRS